MQLEVPDVPEQVERTAVCKRAELGKTSVAEQFPSFEILCAHPPYVLASHNERRFGDAVIQHRLRSGYRIERSGARHNIPCGLIGRKNFPQLKGILTAQRGGRRRKVHRRPRKCNLLWCGGLNGGAARRQIEERRIVEYHP